ncbi:hypothetical protein [Neorhizobium galegae]|uniref:hypothetical protein n=1 Tax=Neorhizobium galegae TaxID=399 RepID=UPI0012D6EC04|nr:hypothetical protein [Neorhizobium galegae]KAB1126512.1 hypothetical protein F4V90_05220 [Neorhizobium galegae]MCQ1808152.1 hypothetical protein [Neorhizobium galegae]
MGYREDERERALQDVPLYIPNAASWPEGVRVVGIEELNNLGIDRSGVLHWNGRVITIEKRFTFSFWQKVSAVVVTLTAGLVSLSTIIQGVASYSSWACTVGWPAICP